MYRIGMMLHEIELCNAITCLLCLLLFLHRIPQQLILCMYDDKTMTMFAVMVERWGISCRLRLSIARWRVAAA
jgi:hypothetical protein